MGGALALDLHEVLDLHVKLGVAACVRPNLEDVVFLKQDQMWYLLYSPGETGVCIVQLQFDEGRAV